MNNFFQDFELFIVICLTLLTKWLMSEEPIVEDESPEHKKARRKRTYGGMVAGAICGYYGPNMLINWSNDPESIVAGLFEQDLIVGITIVMVISGEHIFRALITKVPSWIDFYVKKRIG